MPRTSRISALFVFLSMGFAADLVEAQSLEGSKAAVLLAHNAARDNGLPFMRTPAEVRRYVKSGHFVPVRPNKHYTLSRVSFPFALPETAIFIKRIAAEYHLACREQLVVTSLIRPLNRQPRNASKRSVHPVGMAVDIRISRNRECRSWLEGALMALEIEGVIEATKERRPPHYHVVVLPRRYAAMLARRGVPVSYIRTSTPDPADAAPDAAPPEGGRYRVQPGDSLWTIARRFGVSVERLREVNGITSDQIREGQVLDIPQD